MKTKTRNFLFILYLILVTVLAACNRPTGETIAPQMNATQAYETVAVLLTQGVATDQAMPQVTQAPPRITATQPDPGQETQPVPSDSPTVTHTPTGQLRCDQAAPGYPSIDITIEDDSVLNPGESFTKIWRLVNNGSCAWDGQYAAVWFSGEQMSNLQVIPFPNRVEPGQSVDISVDMVAPLTNGTYQSNWKLRNSRGEYFGIGPEGDSAFWVRIIVNAQATVTPTPSLTPSPTPVVQVSGPVTLAISNTLDLDNLQFNTPTADLNYLRSEPAEDTTIHQLLPLGTSQLAIYGDQQPGLAACQAAALNTQAVTIEDLASGTFLCYRTGQGLPGWLRLDAFDPQTGSLSLTILTWSLP